MHHRQTKHIFAILIFLAAVIPAWCFTDEIDSLQAMLHPPARFKEYVPHFSVERCTVNLHNAGSLAKARIWAVKDGQKYCALIRPEVPVAEGIRMLGFSPDKLPSSLWAPQGRWHLENEPGPVFQTCMGDIPPEADYDITTDGKKVTIKRNYSASENIIELKVDSVYGYMIEARLEIKLACKNFPIAKAETPGASPAWQKNLRYPITVFTPSFRSGYEGFMNNPFSLVNAKYHADSIPGGFCIRDGGFIGFLGSAHDEDIVFTRKGGGATLKPGHCESHNAWHISLPCTAGTVIRQRLLCLPPEISNHIKKEIRYYFSNEKAVAFRLGRKETFEDQPLALNKAFAGVSPFKTVIICDTAGYSGRKCVAFNGVLTLDFPQINLDANALYRLDCMMKVEGDTAVGKIIGKTFEWSAGESKRFIEKETSAVKKKDSWKKVSFEIETPSWDPFINIQFLVSKGNGFIDDFYFRKIEKAHAP